MNDMRHINLTLVISSLSSGGAERVMSILANYWAENGCTVTLITIDSADSDFYKLNDGIKRVSLGLMGESSNPFAGIRNNLKRILKLRHEILASSPDVVICFMEKTNVLTLIATRGLGLNVLVSERTDPAHHDIGKLWNALRQITYKWADVVVAQNNQVKQWLEKFVPVSKVVVIPNPVQYEIRNENYEPLNNLLGIQGDKQTVIAMGRLGIEKGFDMLIKAFAKINSQWQLIIFGEGSERSSLECLVSDLNMRDRIHLPGLVNNPMQYLKQADLFVMTSRFEGFSNSLLEAMACGLPVISFDCPSGPREIIRNGVDGILVPAENIDALADAMNLLMSDESERTRLAAKAPQVLERFAVEKIIAIWEGTLHGMMEKK
jgi:GalNAc-alpha-(1->4)-GalNAc-alpha-(1->3)-diNAcBac-PP-undecaprenol alpha-1,4-N-acetyl-D-galactosaminyltransferase